MSISIGDIMLALGVDDSALGPALGGVERTALGWVTNMGGKLALGLGSLVTAAIGGAVALGVASFKAGETVDEAIDNIIGHVRDQIALVICFRVAPSDALKDIGVPGADRITVTDDRHGRAMTNRWGMVQTYLVDKSTLGNPQKTGRLLTNWEQLLFDAAGRNDGRVTRSLIMQMLGVGVYEAQTIQNELGSLGWIKKRAEADNAYYVTPKWAEIANYPQPPHPPTSTYNQQEALQPTSEML
jgi:hypothetical protein